MTASRQLSLGNLNTPPTTNSSTKNYMGSPSTASKRPSEVSNNDPPSKRATIVPIQPWNPVRSVQNMFQSAEPVVIDDEDTAPLQKTLEAKVEELFKSHFGMMKNGLAKFKGEFQEEIKAQMEKNSGELKQLIQDEIVSAKRELKTSKSASMKTGTSKSGWNECNENENELQQGSVRYVFNVEKLRTEKTLRSPTVIIGGSEWYLCIKDIGDSLRVILCCSMDSDEFLYDTNGRYVLFGQKRAEFKFNHCYAFKSLHIPVLQYLFEQLTDSVNGHITADNHITVQADFNFKRVRNNPIDVRLFSAPTPFRSDCMLVVEDKRLYVNKGLLSVYSAYFDELFNGDPGTNGSNEIVVTDVSVTEFIAMLSAIYPTEDHLVIAGIIHFYDILESSQ
ncbi:BTB/POZ domain-containing protein [Ditylenchus destructor]|uniref:BTB/POZ domain-containing protein n=1 Tax=Ditylenchus destructor TaxID=166010 RepID=A0AAD4MSR9_9BILA|nr:BTB/POZ domain-containing protein [Ditylenchus destructor]